MNKKFMLFLAMGFAFTSVSIFSKVNIKRIENSSPYSVKIETSEKGGDYKFTELKFDKMGDFVKRGRVNTSYQGKIKLDPKTIYETPNLNLPITPGYIILTAVDKSGKPVSYAKLWDNGSGGNWYHYEDTKKFDKSGNAIDLGTGNLNCSQLDPQASDNGKWIDIKIMILESTDKDGNKICNIRAGGFGSKDELGLSK